MSKLMHLSAFTQACPDHHSEGQWKNPECWSANGGYADLDYWMDFARTLERGFFDCLFLADVHGTYDFYRGSDRAAIAHGVQFPGIDPTTVIPAMAAVTRYLGFASTYSTTYFPPYHTAKLFSSLDHLTKGRVAWNIVTSYLPNAMHNFDIREPLEHDERYDRADEYMDVVYKLWEHSWEEGAMIRDSKRDILTDPGKIHRIDHEGKWFHVSGPHMCEPSPQRTPVLFQAGASGRGQAFAGKHAEAVFTVSANIQSGVQDVQKIRKAAGDAGRDPSDIKVMQGVAIIVAPTDEEARLKEQTLRSYASHEASAALLSGWMNMDVSKFPNDKSLANIESKGIQGLAGMFSKIDPNRDWTLDKIKEYMEIGSILPKIIGSPETVADELERWMDECDVDGFNIHMPTQGSGFREFVDLVVPELQRRKRMRTEYESSTLRELFSGAGHARLAAPHPAKRSRSAS